MIFHFSRNKLKLNVVFIFPKSSDGNLSYVEWKACEKQRFWNCGIAKFNIPVVEALLLLYECCMNDKNEKIFGHKHLILKHSMYLIKSAEKKF